MTAPSHPAPSAGPRASSTEPWWKGAVGYQVYPASFCDSDGDGIGDIAGVISKLDHLADLGIGFIWLSPVYASPMVDNGYDISDYRAIDPRFGTLADMDRLIAQARERGIGVVMDLVVNHTSDQHPWFRAARADPASPYRDYYVWREAKPEPGEPADLQATFGGSAWSYDEAAGAWYLHLFTPEQPDLNWANPRVRAEVHDLMNWWLDRGLAGFRMDVIDLIGKEPAQGVTSDGPRLHDYLQEMHRAVLDGRDVLTVGEAWSATPANAPLYSALERRELSMVFQFEQVTRFWDDRLGKWRPLPVDAAALQAIFARWQAALHDRGWNSLFWSNHDLPRAVSRYGEEGEHRVASAKMLATVLHLMEGTPFVYQGEEIGMTNAGFASISDYRDVETLDQHGIQLANGMSEADFLAAAATTSRDNARTPMQWTAGRHGGFTTGEPWIAVNANADQINVERDRADPHGVFERYRRLIALRRELPIVRRGDFRLLATDQPALFGYERRLDGRRLVVLANFGGRPVAAALVGVDALQGHDPLTGEPAALLGPRSFAPYEVVLVLGD